jgi:hypothetical protein
MQENHPRMNANGREFKAQGASPVDISVSGGFG